MNYYYITKKDQQYGNCLYMATNHPNRVRFNDEDYTITIKDDIIWYLTNDLYGDIRSSVDEYESCNMAQFHKIRRRRKE